MKKSNDILQLFLSTMKIGAFTFGGGYAMISVLESEFVTNKKWLEHDEFMDLIAIAESTPGPIAINSATYIGYKKAGVLGSAFATLGMVLPSFTIIFLISLFFDEFLSISWVSSAFRGIQACVVFLILKAGIKMLKKLKKTPMNLTLLILTFLCMLTFTLLSVSFSSVLYILISGCVGLTVYAIGYMKNKKGGAK